MPVRHRLALLLLASLVLTTGCSGSAPSASPAPATRTPAPIETASDEAAFREAEATYRAYVDALNAVDLSDPATFEPVFALTTGRVNEEDRRVLSNYHAAGVTMDGSTEITRVIRKRIDGGTAQLYVCIDVSSIEVHDRSGQSLVEADRSPVQRMLVSAVKQAGHPGPMVLTDVVGTSEGPAC
ncbi:hypothetical protein [Microbacterium imperiale]|uniref:Nuclear transport factor 2 family protein n=1 Tax=Microbacterium imperiale TaxID=33884 RepID=A0A9W6M2H4_9MICO|nr:hypothetical protein [Microbacterium imperiale]MBP2419887.1 hypothetical protein [Microbacterium imperiale]MDS0198249.1 hypothetical protein [Microbacterium imperiale]BFE40226.1 hypothetical protein GCM10017544_11820 [Microbacterium imperiale]GLJ78797.1 hypothetical protein GCM10017586_04790 [Microbacterium imperiale]